MWRALFGAIYMGEKLEFQKMTMSPTSVEEQKLKPEKVPLHKRRKCRICCGVCLVVWILLAIVAVVLSLTIFKFRDPRVSLVNAKLQNVTFNLDMLTLSALLNISISADVRVDNPNYYDFKYTNSTIDMKYHVDEVGVVNLGAGTIRSRKTVDLPAVIKVEAISLAVNSLQDLSSNVATLDLDTVMRGRVNLAKIYKKHVTAILNCTLDIFISNQTLKQTVCKQKIKL